MLTGIVSPADQFQTGSVSHLACLLGCVALVLLFGLAGKRANDRGDTAVLRRLRRFAGYGGLVMWVASAVFCALPPRLSWDYSLPLHFCNLANLIGAAAVLGPWRIWKSVLYFWTVTLCIWAFLTPVIGGGYGTLEFWVFWGYHLFIPLTVVEVLVVQRFRPNLRDLRNAWIFTFCYFILLVVLDRIFGWTYGFVGPSKPGAPTPLDVLGDYPLRLLVMIPVTTGRSLLAWWPWRMRD